jgi:uncharacterized damage-inducible protein DinB
MKEGRYPMTTESQTTTIGERAEFLQALAQHRFFLRFTVRDLSDEQAAQRTTVSALCLGGLIKHVAEAESKWVDFIVGGPAAMGHGSGGGADSWVSNFRMEPGESLSDVLEHYEQVACRTAEVVDGLPDLEVSHPLPEAPWFEAGARWSARRALLHIIAETAQHAGHADIIRESLDGSKTMG